MDKNGDLRDMTGDSTIVPDFIKYYIIELMDKPNRPYDIELFQYGFRETDFEGNSGSRDEVEYELVNFVTSQAISQMQGVVEYRIHRYEDFVFEKIVPNVKGDVINVIRDKWRLIQESMDGLDSKVDLGE